MTLIVPEHSAQAEPDQTVQALVSQPGQDQTVKMVQELLNRYKKNRRRFDIEWHSNYEFLFGGKQWNMDRPAWRFSEVNNFIWSNVMTEVGVQTDSRPKVEYIASNPNDYQFVDVLQKMNDQNWSKYPWLQTVQDAVVMTKWVHVVHALVGWDTELEDGLGDVSFELLDPFYSWWDPYALDVNGHRGCRGFIYAPPVPTDELKMKYPQFKDLIKPDIETFDMKQGWRTSPDIDRFSIWGSRNYRSLRHGDRFGGEPMSMLVRLWLRDKQVEELQQEEENGQTLFIQKMKYPKGRYIEMQGTTILCDREIEYEDGKFPIARLVNYSYPLEYAGEHEVTNLRGPQRTVNYVISHALDQMKQGGNPVWVNDSTSGIDPETITNEPGLVLTKTPGSQVQRVQGTGLAPGTEDIIAAAKGDLDKISGVGDVLKGAVDPAVSSGLLFDGYVEAAQIRPRLKNRNLDQFLQQVGQLMLSRYLQYYTAPRTFRMTNEQGWPEHVEFYISKDEAGNSVANMTTTTMPPDQPPQVGQTVSTRIMGSPDVKVVSGSSLPFAKAQKTKTAMDLFAAKAIDQEELLKAIDWPNSDAVMQRMRDAAANQPPPPPPGGK